MSAGNRTVLAVIDSRNVTDRLSSDHTIFAALKHFGIPCEVLDGGDYMGAVPEYIAPRALYIIAHDGAAQWLKPEVAAQCARKTDVSTRLSEPCAQADWGGAVTTDRIVHPAVSG